MEQYIGKKFFREIMTYIIGGLSAVLLLMGIVFTIIAMVGSNENNDMMDIATIGYVFAVIFLIIFGIQAGSGYIKRPKQTKQSLKKLKERGLLELAQQEFEEVKDKTLDCILTTHFIYFRGTGMVIPVEDIAWAHMYMTKVNGSPLNFRPWIYDVFGNEYTAVYLYNTKKFDDMNYRINYTKKLNPNIMLGYSKEIQQIYNQKYKKK